MAEGTVEVAVAEKWGPVEGHVYGNGEGWGDEGPDNGSAGEGEQITVD